LNALQYLVHLAINKEGKQYYTVTVDAEGYRARRQETLETLADRMAQKAIQIKRKVALEPMPAYERKIIHSALQKNNKVSTYSDGVEPHPSKLKRSEEHTSELQSRFDLVCRRLLEK